VNVGLVVDTGVLKNPKCELWSCDAAQDNGKGYGREGRFRMAVTRTFFFVVGTDVKLSLRLVICPSS
jgi:hypothetical protein